ncbi:acetyltransferase [Actibacterium mucosum KCTC 23349]|uniref:Acetyltransferase n=1 Tax=Actibacterium mucosum KCTC 23349 TaxID=1454373 RepID=A0A037ZQS4_9RHOB|nr:GNAT family N-acetyltransferase [Actibacterium mucosum]KAJ57217.1 acetyltransferase [Actibacterium mucosum KCTC 23349]
MIHVRKAGALDTRAMAELLNTIIAVGGTTALTQPVTGADLRMWMQTPGSHWIVAEDDSGEILGFQWIEPTDELPQDAVSIATFSQVGKTGLGIGSALFRDTCDVAKKAGLGWISAEIRTDNIGGLTYYKSRGFEEYGRKIGHVLQDGTVVDKVLARYEL